MSAASGTMQLAELDPATIARLQRAIAGLEPDPLFRRRLRGELLNRHVAIREGLIRTTRGRRQMGRLGRATLYASLGLAMSVTAAGAAAQESLPGDVLYSVKLQLEEIRMQVAPASMRADLAVLALDERLDEIERLAQDGAWARIAAAAPRVEAAERRVEAFGAQVSGTELAEIHRHAAVIEQLLLSAPEAARPGLRAALEASSAGPGAPGRGSTPNASWGNGRGNGNAGQGAGAGAGGNASAPPLASSEAGASASPSARPSHPPRATAAPEATQAPEATEPPTEPTEALQAPEAPQAQDGDAQN